MITVTSFPTPALAVRTSDGAELDRVRGFARDQAAAADTVREQLLLDWSRCRSLHARLAALRRAHADVMRWRYEQARRAPRRLGEGLRHDPERFRMPLAQGGPNTDRLGPSGRLRAVATWDPELQVYRGGTPTPASEILEAYGKLALARFGEQWLPDDDVLLNVVSVPGSRRLLAGNRLVRGRAAQRIAAELVARVAARGRDTNTMEVGGNPVYIVTADPVADDALFGIGLLLLAHAADPAEPAEPRTARVRAWQHARYLLYQAPRTKKGSDATTRTFLVAVGAALTGTAPVLEQDVDLRCMVLGQCAATVMPADESLFR